MEYLCHKWNGYVALVVNTSRSFPRSWLITGCLTRITWWVSVVEQELLTLVEDLSSSPIFSGVRVTRSLVLCVCFVDRCLSFCTLSFVHCVVCSSIYGCWLLLWYLQTLLTRFTEVISLYGWQKVYFHAKFKEFALKSCQMLTF